MSDTGMEIMKGKVRKSVGKKGRATGAKEGTERENGKVHDKGSEWLSKEWVREGSQGYDVRAGQHAAHLRSLVLSRWLAEEVFSASVYIRSLAMVDTVNTPRLAGRGVCISMLHLPSYLFPASGGKEGVEKKSLNSSFPVHCLDWRMLARW